MNEASPPDVVYGPEAQLKHPIRLFQSMVRDLVVSRELAWRLLVRNVQAQYRQTVLGYLWAFIPPIITTATFVFLTSNGVLTVTETEIPYPVYVLVGTVLWQAFMDAVNGPIKLVTSSRAMLAKVNFPREALILASLGEVVLNLVIRLLLVVGVMFWYDVPAPESLWIAPIGVCALVAFGLMVGLLLTPVGVLFQDVERTVTLALSLWFFLTPVVYPPPTQWPASLVAQLNPVSPLLITARQLLTGGQITTWPGFLVVSGITLVLLAFGWVLYRVAMPHIIARIGS